MRNWKIIFGDILLREYRTQRYILQRQWIFEMAINLYRCQSFDK